MTHQWRRQWRQRCSCCVGRYAASGYVTDLPILVLHDGAGFAFSALQIRMYAAQLMTHPMPRRSLAPGLDRSVSAQLPDCRPQDRDSAICRSRSWRPVSKLPRQWRLRLRSEQPAPRLRPRM